MTRWEYTSALDHYSKWAELGRAGWEAYAVLPGPAGIEKGFFKRSLPHTSNITVDAPPRLVLKDMRRPRIVSTGVRARVTEKA